jgi:hypothetical protein
MKNSHVLVLLLSVIAGAVLALSLPPKPGLPAGLQYRQLFEDSSAAGERATAVRVTIGEIKDAGGSSVWLGSKFVSLCPGDTVAIGLSTPGNGHISRFEVIDPFSGDPLEVTFPSSYKSTVVKGADVTFQVPAGTAPGDYPMQWNADIFIIEPDKNEDASLNTQWFQIIAPDQFSQTGTLKVVAPETRAAQVRQKERGVYPQFYKFLGVTLLAGAGMVLARRKEMLNLFIFGVFAGYAILFFLVNFDELNYNGGLFLGTLAAVGLIIFLLLYSQGIRQKR